jgi:AhpD family alkylhydroperoxidase
MTVATRNGCHVCVAMHTARLGTLGAQPEVIAARMASRRADRMVAQLACSLSRGWCARDNRAP